jgi:hypothetical protein
VFSIGSLLIYASDFEAVQEDIILSPDSRELADYEEYCRRELPRTFRGALEEIVHNESQPIEENIKNQLMNIIRDCQDRVFSSYRSLSTVATAVAVVRTPSRNPIASDSPVMASQESMAMVSMSADALPEPSFGHIAPPFFQPPPPQTHLQSRLEVSDLQGNTTKAPDGSDPSDSGYSSNESGVPSGISSSFNNTSDSAFLSNSQPHIVFSGPVPANAQGPWDMDNGQFDMNTGKDVMNSRDTSIFNQSWLDYNSQLAAENVWNPYISNIRIDDPFSSDQAL